MDIRKVVIVALVGLSVAGQTNPEESEYQRLRNSLHVINGIDGYDLKKISVDELRSLVLEGSHGTEVWWVKTDWIRELTARKAFSGEDWCEVLKADSDPMFWTSCGEIIRRLKPTFNLDQRKKIGSLLLNIDDQLPTLGFRFWLQANDTYNFCKKVDLISPRIVRLRAQANRLESEMRAKPPKLGQPSKVGAPSP